MKALKISTRFDAFFATIFKEASLKMVAKKASNLVLILRAFI